MIPLLAANLASPLIRYAAVGIVAAVAAVTVTRWYYSGKIARMEATYAQREAEATRNARIKDNENAALAADADIANATAKDALEKLADATRAHARDHGLWVKAKRQCMPGAATAAGSGEDGTAFVRVSDETADALIAFARDADAAAIYARTCHDWAVRIGR